MRHAAHLTIAALLTAATMTPAVAQEQFRDKEFNAQWGLAAIGAQYALFERGITGVGIGVVVVDTAFQTTHPEFNLPTDTGWVIFNNNPNSERPTGKNHGTHVAGIIGAGRNGFGVELVAGEPDPYIHRRLYGLQLARTVYKFERIATDGTVRPGIPRRHRRGYASSTIRSGTIRWDAVTISTLTARRRSLARQQRSPGFQRGVDAGALLVRAAWRRSPTAVHRSRVCPTGSRARSRTASQSPRSIGTSSARPSTFNACGVGMYFCMAAPGTDIYSTITGSAYATTRHLDGGAARDGRRGSGAANVP